MLKVNIIESESRCLWWNQSADRPSRCEVAWTGLHVCQEGRLTVNSPSRFLKLRATRLESGMANWGLSCVFYHNYTQWVTHIFNISSSINLQNEFRLHVLYGLRWAWVAQSVVTRLRAGRPRDHGSIPGRCINPLNAELNPICHLLALLGAHHILHVSRIRVKLTNTFHLLSRLRMRGGMPSLLHMPSCHAQIQLYFTSGSE